MTRNVYAVVLLTALSIMARAQQCADQNGFGFYFPDGAHSAQGLGCYYSIQLQSGNVGCWADAYCNNGRVASASFYQWWSCSPGGAVDAQGSSNTDSSTAYCPLSGNWEDYVVGVVADAYAGVFPAGGGIPRFYGGWDDIACDGSSSYSGPFNYSC